MKRCSIFMKVCYIDIVYVIELYDNDIPYLVATDSYYIFDSLQIINEHHVVNFLKKLQL